jgi:hypothetical protein
MGGLLGKKSFWAGLGLIGFGIYQIATGMPDEGIQSVGIGLATIFIRDGIRKLENK